MSDLTLRTLVGFALVAVAAVALGFGGIFFWLLTAVIALLMMAEWSDLFGVPPKTKRLAQFSLFVPLAIMCPIAAGPGFLRARAVDRGGVLHRHRQPPAAWLALGTRSTPGCRCSRCC